MNRTSDLLKDRPAGSQIRKWNVLAIVCTVLIVVVRLESVIQTRLPVNETGDFAYFFTAAQSYFRGFGPYGPDYKALLGELFPSFFPVAFFYPPQTLAILLPFGTLETETATEIFFRVNAACLLTGVMLSWWWLSQKTYVVPAAYIGAVFIPFAAGLAAPAMSSLLNSNFSNILLIGFVTWAHGATKGNPILQGIGLTLLMLKPSLALSFLMISVLVPAYRPATLIAIALTAVLYLIGGSYTDPLSAFIQYLSGLSDFALHPGNAPTNLVGIFAFVDPEIVQPNAVLSIMACVGAALAALGLGASNAWKTGLIAVCLTLLLSPVHIYDMVLLIPALFLSVTRGPIAPRLILFVTMTGIILGERLSALGFDTGHQFQTILLVITTLAATRLRLD